MDIPQKLQEFLENTGLSIETLRYGVSLLKVNDELNEHREQCDIRTDHYLANVNVITNERTNYNISMYSMIFGNGQSKNSLVFLIL